MTNIVPIEMRPPSRAVAYIRVSDEHGRGEALTSPAIQLASIQEHCSRMGYNLVETLEDIDLTGRFWKRRQVERAITLIEQGDADVLVVWKISRVARNRRDWAVAVDRIETIGGRLESATEPNDSNASGRFARGVLAELAAFEAERIGETWAETHARRASQGLPHSGAERWGYKYNAHAKIHEVDPVTGPELAQAYRRYIGGASIYTITADLNDRGFRTSSGFGRKRTHGHWTTVTLRRLLDAGFGAGFIISKGERRPGAHAAVIEPHEWEAYVAARDARRPKRSSERSRYLLSGLVRCACGSAMSGGQFGRGRTAAFRCGDAATRRTHKATYPKMTELEALVLEWLATVADEVDDALESAQQTARSDRAVDPDAELARQALDLSNELELVTREYLRKVIPEPTYISIRDGLVTKQAALESRRRSVRVAARRPTVSVLAGSLLERWDEDDVESRRAALRELISHVLVTPPSLGGTRTISIVAAWED